MKYSGARILIESLIENGVDTVFGYPGSAVLEIYDELYKNRDRIRHILVSHEQHAAHAADGYARSSGKTGVCIATSGPGAANLVTGIATAYVDSVPIIAIAGNVSIPLLGKDSFQEVDITGITMPIVKHNWIVEDVRDLAQIVREAFVVAQSGRPGPVLIDIPKDISSAVCEYNALVDDIKAAEGRAGRFLKKTSRETFTQADIEKAAMLIENSAQPMIFAGGGVIHSGAGTELRKFAEHLNAPVAMSLMGLGAFPKNHRLCTGLTGMYGTIASNKAIQNTDLLIAIGARFSDRVTNSIVNDDASQKRRFAPHAKILHIDIDPAEINKNIIADASIIGEAKKILIELIKKIPASKTTTAWNEKIEKWKAQAPKERQKKITLHPRFVIQETAKALSVITGDDAIVVTDVGQHQIWTAQFYPINNPRSFLSSGGMGTMGFGLGAALGAKIANPAKNVVLFSGDGCFRMNSAEMSTLVKYGIPVLIIIFNNNTLGMLRQWQNLLYNAHYSETDLDNRGPDFVKLAAAYNIEAFRAVSNKSFNDALSKSISILASGKPVLIEAVIDKDERVY